MRPFQQVLVLVVKLNYSVLKIWPIIAVTTDHQCCQAIIKSHAINVYIQFCISFISLIFFEIFPYKKLLLLFGLFDLI